MQNQESKTSRRYDVCAKEFDHLKLNVQEAVLWAHQTRQRARGSSVGRNARVERAMRVSNDYTTTIEADRSNTHEQALTSGVFDCTFNKTAVLYLSPLLMLRGPDTSHRIAVL